MAGPIGDRLTLGPARRRRRMHRLLRQLDAIDALDAREGDSGPYTARPASGRRGGTAVQLTLTVGVVVAAVLAGSHLSAGTPLGTPPQVATGVGTFAFSAEQPGRPGVPVTYSPCKPIRYVVNDAAAPPGAAALLDEALAEITAATGLVLEDAGSTDRLPFRSGLGELVGRPGPVIIAWTTPEDVPGLAGDVVGLGGSASANLSGGFAQYLTGGVALDGPTFAEILAWPDGWAHGRAIVMHELAHLVGLDHVDDPGELLYADNVGATSFGPGDLEGLAALGSGRCP